MVLTALCTLLLVGHAAAEPATALRSGPDVAVPASVDRTRSPGDDSPVGPPDGSRAGRGDASRAAAFRADGSRTGAAPTGYVPPVPGLSPPSGVEHPFDAPEQAWGAGHRGVDLTAPTGSRVVSPGPGVVTFAGQVARRGVVVVTHPDGLRSSLEPVMASVPVGATVAAGGAIGVVEGGPGGGGDGRGTTPNHCAPGSCVHWGVRRGERYLDPLSLLDRPPIVLLPDH